MSNFFNRLLNDSSSSDEEERNTWFAAALEFERQYSQGTGYGDRVSRQYRYRDRVSGNSQLLNDYFVTDMGSYLADSIYPKWATIVQSITHPQDLAHAFFANKHESYRKDVERAFGVL